MVSLIAWGRHEALVAKHMVWKVQEAINGMEGDDPRMADLLPVYDSLSDIAQSLDYARGRMGKVNKTLRGTADVGPGDRDPGSGRNPAGHRRAVRRLREDRPTHPAPPHLEERRMSRTSAGCGICGNVVFPHVCAGGVSNDGGMFFMPRLGSDTKLHDCPTCQCQYVTASARQAKPENE